MQDLNPRQLEAARYIDGPCLVLAGAGSGKTRVITHKIAWLIGGCGIAPANIAALTFTNKAAREMKGRVGQLLRNGSGRGLVVSTFHNLGLRILHAEKREMGLRDGFSIMDEQDTLHLMREVSGAEPVADGDYAALRWQISQWKDDMISPEQALQHAEDGRQAHAARLFAAYQRALRAYNAVDFDDLIGRPVQLFESRPDILEKWQGRLRFLLVDEYQDTNISQYRLVKLLAGARAALTVVGDDDQSIYAWRGARPENMVQLQTDYPNLKVIKLEQNYRSSRRILEAANRLIDNNPHTFKKALWSDLGMGDPIRVLQAKNDVHEAEWVVSEIISHRFRHRGHYRDYAILYRGNHQARPFEKLLREQRIPYFLSGGTSFFARSEVRDIMGYLRVLSNPDDDTAFLRVVNTPRREIGAATLERLGEYAGERGISLFEACYELGLEQRLPPRGVASLRKFTDWINRIAELARGDDPVAALRQLVEDIDYRGWLEGSFNDPKAVERRMENVNELLTWMQRMLDKEPSELPELAARMALMDILEQQDEENDADRVNLMTLHAAKGLEFPHVFVVGMEEELLPHHSNLEGPGLEEERRLAYVGITRAQRSLSFSFASKRKRFGEVQDREPSRFLGELPDGLEWKGTTEPVDPVERQEKGKAHLANLRGMLSQP